MDRKQRLEENEKLFREVNERVEQVHAGFHSDSNPEWVCECGDETCFEKVSVPLEEYHRIRARDDWFLIRPGHEKVDVEDVVERHGGYYVVQKFDV